VGWALSHPVLVGIGIISYPLYLWHLPLLTFLKTTDIAEVTRTAKIVVIAASFILAWGTYRFVERPIRFGSTSSAPRVAVVLLLIMTLVGSGGLWIYSAQGFPNRYPASMQALLGTGAIPDHDNQDAMEFGTCFLHPQQDPEKFSAKCLDPERTKSSAEEVLLWGDSHAAHLFPGLADLYRQRSFKFVRLGAAGCPPVIGHDVRGKPMCRSINDHVQRVIAQRRPRTVILAADWASGNPDDVQTTIEFLRDRSVRRIVLVGPVPQWTKPLYKIVISDTLRRTDHAAPQRIAHSLVDRVPEIDAYMRALARNNGIDYVSAWDALCNKDGCLARIGDGFRGIITLDRSHFTPAGSVFVAKRLFRDLL
jgi:hypothetical protein